MDRQVVIFVGILAIVALIIAMVFSASLSPFAVLLILLLIVAFAAFSPRIFEFKEFERGIILRFGKFERVAGPGWILLFPFESAIKVDMRVQTIDTKPQEVETLDDIVLKVDAITYYRITDPKKVILEIKDVQTSVTKLLISEIRSAVAKMPMEDVVEKSEELSDRLYAALKEVDKAWGIDVMRVELESVELPPSVVTAMHRKREAMEYKSKAEIEASAKQISLEVLEKATGKMSDRTLAYLYLDALKKIADGRSTKIIFPLELSRLASVISGKMGGKQSKQDYEQLLESLLQAYNEKQKEALSKKAGKEEVSKGKDAIHPTEILEPENEEENGKEDEDI